MLNINVSFDEAIKILYLITNILCDLGICTFITLYMLNHNKINKKLRGKVLCITVALFVVSLFKYSLLDLFNNISSIFAFVSTYLCYFNIEKHFAYLSTYIYVLILSISPVVLNLLGCLFKKSYKLKRIKNKKQKSLAQYCAFSDNIVQKVSFNFIS